MTFPVILVLATLAHQAPAQVFIAQGQALIVKGDFDAALRAADAADAAQEHAAAEEIRGAIAEARESLSAAAGHYAQALQWAERAGSSPLMAEAAESLARAYGQQGRIDLTLALANRMLDRDPANRALYLFERGLAYSSLNDPDAALTAFDEALSLAQSAGNLKLIAQIHRQRGLWIWRYKRDLPQTIHEYEEALAYARRAQAWRIAVLTLINYGNPFRNRKVNRLPEALRRYEQGLVIARREHLRDETAYLLKNMGDVYRQQGDAARAEPLLDEAVQIADQANVEEVRWMARDELGMLLRDRDPARAERNLREALAIIENYQSDVLLEDFRPGALAGEILFANPYADLIDLLLTEHREGEAFFIAERQRARAFLETLSASRETLASAVPRGFREAEQQILDRIKTAQALLRGDSLTEAGRAALVTGVGRDETELQHLRLRLAIESPSLAHARFPRLWTAGDIQSKLLHADETLLSVYLGTNRSVAWVVTRERVHTIVLPAAGEIESRARAALEELRNPLTRDRAALAALSRVLSIDTIARLSTGTRLIIVPSGILFDVPFEALLDAQAHPLVERFALSYVPSASSLAFLRSIPPRTPAAMTFVAVANPVVSGTSAAANRQFDLAHMNLLAPVPNTATEVRGIARLFENSAIFEGPRATRSNVRSAMEQGLILHFATHGLIDDIHPDRSGLLLTADPPRDDGLLQARDVYSLHLNADLVTLSACETALGKNVTGEGMIGLTRAFFFAGARSVVASLWDVDDAATSRFMQRFYANIRRGEAIDIALQHAKIDFLRGRDATSAPFFWASFIVSGQARSSIEVPPSTRTVPLTIGLAGVLVVALWCYLRIVNVRRSDETMGRP